MADTAHRKEEAVSEWEPVMLRETEENVRCLLGLKGFKNIPKFSEEFCRFISFDGECWSIKTHERYPPSALNLLKWMKHNEFEDSEIDLTIDAGTDQAEFQSKKPLLGSREYFYSFANALNSLARLSSPVRFLFLDYRPDKIGPASWCSGNKRHEILREIMQEGNTGFDEKIIRRASWHWHIGGISPFTSEGVLVRNVLDNVAPCLANIFSEISGGPKFRNAFWREWTTMDSRRLPSYRQFEDGAELFEYLNSTRHILTPDGLSRANESKSLNAMSLKQWWLAYPSPHGSIELRCFGSANTVITTVQVRVVDWIVGAVLGVYEGKIPRFSRDEWWMEFQGNIPEIGKEEVIK